MKFDILTLFPAMFQGPLTESILKRAQTAGLISIELHDIRAYTTDRHRTADDAPYGGGAGMVMKPAPLAAAIRAVLDDRVTGWQADKVIDPETMRLESQQIGHDLLEDVSLSASQPVTPSPRPTVILLSPDGELFTQALAEELAQQPGLILVCGHYEGVDERVREALIDREISIGDYVLTGGELAAMVIVDAVARLVPGVLDAESTAEESHGDGLLEYPHYTRPAEWEGRAVPAVLLSGHHGEVAKWRRRQRLRRTLERRPDMFARVALSKADREYIAALREDEGRKTEGEISLPNENTTDTTKA